jgi:hypothetical protein
MDEIKRKKYWRIGKDIVLVVIAALGLWVGFIRKKALELMNEGLQVQLERILSDNQALRKKNQYQRAQIENLSIIRESVENSIDILPNAAFVKIWDKRQQVWIMYDMSPGYVKRYLNGTSKSEYLGGLDEVVHEGEFSAVYRQNDMKLWRRIEKGEEEPQADVVEPSKPNGQDDIVWENWCKWIKKRGGDYFLYGFLKDE